MAVRARLPFTIQGEPGEIALDDSGMVTVTLSPRLYERFAGFCGDAETQVVAWGSSLTMALGALGTLCITRERRLAGFALFGIAGATALLAATLRRGAQELAFSLDRPYPASCVAVVDGNDGVLIRIARTGLPPIALTLRPGEVDPDAVDAFSRALTQVRGAAA